MDLSSWNKAGARATLLGHSSWSPQRLLEAIAVGRPVRDLPGDFVLVAGRDDGRQLVATSVIGARPYLYVDKPGPAFHGRDVFTVAAQAGLRWSWNLDALRAMAWFGHTVGAQTLHPQVRRVPPAAVMEHTGDRWRCDEQPYWQNVFRAGRVGLDDAVDVFHEVCDELLAQDPLISLSGGFDSRAMLSRALAKGNRPETLTVGYPSSTDVVIAQAIAADHDVKHTVVELDPEDYFRHANLITRLTSGTKTFNNWHAFMYCQGRDPHRAHLIGSNGEFARTFYLDRGVASRVAGVGGRLAARGYWMARLGRRANRLALDLPFLTPGGPRDVSRFANSAVGPSSRDGGNALDILDRFYATHRVRHFIGNGLNLAGHHTLPVSPFLDARVISAVAGLPRGDKLGSNFHRRIIERNAPTLLRYPAGGRPTMTAKAERGYWRSNEPPGTPYSPMAEVYRDPRIAEILADSPHVAQFLPPAARIAVAQRGHPAAKELLITLHYAGCAAEALPSPSHG